MNTGSLVDRQAFWDPDGKQFGRPTFPWRSAPTGLFTRRQLAAQGLRPNGQDVAAQVMRGRRNREPLIAYLYRADLAAPKRTPTERQLEALAKATEARRQRYCEQQDERYQQWREQAANYGATSASTDWMADEDEAAEFDRTWGHAR